jgi:hypothetical protein
MEQPVEAEEGKVLYWQHLYRCEPGSRRVVIEHGSPHQSAGAFRGCRRQAVGKADQRAVPIHRLLHRITGRDKVIGDRLVHDHYQAVRCDGVMDCGEHLHWARHIVKTLESKSSVKWPKIAEHFPLRAGEPRPIRNTCRLSIVIRCRD